MIPVLDLFAGPGGLGEGFSAYRDGKGKHRYHLSLSIEKDERAHQTLRFRALQRRLQRACSAQFTDLIAAGRTDWSALAERFPLEAAQAGAEARCLELGRAGVATTRELIDKSVRTDGAWVLIGGPPCQAYSLVGRSRNKGITGYEPELDHRQTLYVEYLQIVADHAPPVFVMENVKGILSAQLHSQLLFKRILEDLAEPSKALAREGRRTVGPSSHYSIRALSVPPDLFAEDPNKFVIRSELFGIPQRRHRVILVGVRSDVQGEVLALQEQPSQLSVRKALASMPKLRSGFSKEVDSDAQWLDTIRSFRTKPWFRKVDAAVAQYMTHVLGNAGVPAGSRGAEVVRHRGHIVLNHSSRGHITLDLQRYFFASAFAAVHERSPVLAEFPAEILPMHENVRGALGSGLFADRFRVQLFGSPSTTITSHISKDGHYYIHPDAAQCRSLTVREAARLQTFPDDYFFCGPRTSQYHQVGNAVPPKLAEQIASSISGILGA